MAHVFISHSTHDRHFVESEIVPVLTAAGHRYWYSKEAIRGAELWERSIVHGLEGCDWFAVVLSVQAATSEFVKDEINWAMENRSGRIIPIVIDDCKLTDFHIRLPRIQYVDFRKDKAAAGKHIVDLLREHNNEPAVSDGSDAAPEYATAKQDWIDSRSGSSARAIPACNRLIESKTLTGKKLALVHNARGCSFVRDGRHDEAVADFTAAIAIEPRDPTFYVNRGGLYLEAKGEPDKALPDLELAAAMEPNDLTCNKLLGKLHLKAKRYAQAATFLDRAVEDVHWVTGTQLGAIASAEGYFDLEAYYYRGQAYEVLGDKKQAIENFQLVAWWPVEGEEGAELQIQAKARLLCLTEKQ